MKRVLLLESYYGGSHKYFLQGLQNYVPAEFQLLTLPARSWKMRMQLSAPWFVEQIRAKPVDDRQFDTVLCSSLIDVAVLKGLLSTVAGWNSHTRILTYFHENQFVYPQQFDVPREYQFACINFNSAIASDEIAFNSVYNRDSFLAGCRMGVLAAADMPLPGIIQNLSDRSRILFPGIDFSAIDSLPGKRPVKIPVVVWNHRWEHDKNPVAFFEALQILEQRGVDFRLIVLGRDFPASPVCFTQAKKRFQDKILHFGFVSSYREYVELLGRGDIVVSTSLHEFFGISVIEAVRAGCLPVLPDRLSYPELFDSKFLYDGDTLADRLQTIIENRCRLSREEARAMTNRFSWPSLQDSYSAWL